MSGNEVVTAGASTEEVGEDADFLQLWSASLEEVLVQISGAPHPVEFTLDPPSGPAAESGDIYFVIVLSGAMRGEMSVRVPRAAGLALVRLMLGQAQSSEAEWTAEHRDALEEFFRQVAGRAAPAIRSSWGEVQLRVESGPLPSWAAAAIAWTSSPAGAPLTFQLEWKLSAALAAELAAADARRDAAPPMGELRVPAAKLSDTNPPVAACASAESGLTAKLDLFKDVELEVTLRFGGRRMLLREILDLGPGAVVELDRQVQDPVDLLLDGKIIARGEVVVVEGNYGLRVLEVLAS